MEEPALSEDHAELLRAIWWPAVATLTRMFGDLEAAEDAVQDACLLAVSRSPNILVSVATAGHQTARSSSAWSSLSAGSSMRGS